jgi:hypothetical protein
MELGRRGDDTMNRGWSSGRIGRAMRRRGFLCALLLYFALDLSLPMLPGAFVFEPENSIESIRVQRGRQGAFVLAWLDLDVDEIRRGGLLAPTRVPLVRSEPAIDVSDRLAPTRELVLGFRVLTHRPRGTLDPAPSSEDSH